MHQAYGSGQPSAAKDHQTHAKMLVSRAWASRGRAILVGRSWKFMHVLDLLVPMLCSLPTSLYSCHGLPGQFICLRKLLESEQDQCPSRAVHTHFQCTNRTSSGHTVRSTPPTMEGVKKPTDFFPGSPCFHRPSPVTTLPIRLQQCSSSPAQNAAPSDSFYPPRQQKVSLLPLSFHVVSDQTSLFLLQRNSCKICIVRVLTLPQLR